MDGLRGFAVLLVFLVHYESLLEPWIAGDASVFALAKSLQAIGNCGVDLFFLLSGYLIYSSLLTGQHSFPKFFVRRLQRIYPAFTAVFAMYVALSFLLPSENKIPDDQAGLYLLGNFLLLPGLLPIRPMITVAWSLSYEMFYYLALPALFALAGLRDRTVRWRVVFFISIAVAFAAYSAMNGGPIRLIMFVSGIALYEAINNSDLQVPGMVGLAALIAGMTCMMWPVVGPAGDVLQILVLFATFFVFCLACFRMPHGWLPEAFSWTPLRWLGTMSYSFYLLHGLALKGAFLALSKIIPPTGQQSVLHWALVLPMLVLALIPSAGLFLFIERPFSLARGIRSESLPPQAVSAESRP